MIPPTSKLNSGRPHPAKLDQTALRRANMSLILRHLQVHGATNRTRIATATGLSKAALSNIVSELVDRELVRIDGLHHAGSVGRPSVSYSLDGRGVCGIGVEINGEYLALTAVDLRGAVLREVETPLDVATAGPRATMRRVGQLLTKAVASLTSSGCQVAGVTVSAPGVIDYDGGVVRFAPNLGWRDVAVVDEIKAQVGADFPPISLENDAKLGAVAEYSMFYREHGVDDLLFVTGQVGVGAGIIAHGELLRGWHGFSGEVGHLPLAPDDKPCACGRRGCWESLVGLSAFLHHAASENDEVLEPSRLVDDRLTILQERAAHGDEQTLRALREISRHLATGLSILTDVLNPEVVILGGWFAFFGDQLLDPVREILTERSMDRGSWARLEVSTLGMTGTSRGGAITAVDVVLRDPLLVEVTSSSSARA